MAESRTLFVTCHSSHERDRRSHTCVSAARGSSPGEQQVGAMARQGQLRLCHLCHTRPQGWAGTSPAVACPLSQLLIELGVAFCVSCHKQLILWRVLEGSEIHLE